MKHLAKDKDSKVVEDAEEKVQSLLFTFNQGCSSLNFS